jgi:hypothetical protein
MVPVLHRRHALGAWHKQSRLIKLRNVARLTNKWLWRWCSLLNSQSYFRNLSLVPYFEKNTGFRKLDLFPNSGRVSCAWITSSVQTLGEFLVPVSLPQSKLWESFLCLHHFLSPNSGRVPCGWITSSVQTPGVFLVPASLPQSKLRESLIKHYAAASFHTPPSTRYEMWLLTASRSGRLFSPSLMFLRIPSLDACSS